MEVLDIKVKMILALHSRIGASSIMMERWIIRNIVEIMDRYMVG